MLRPMPTRPAWTGGQYSVYRVLLALLAAGLLFDGAPAVKPVSLAAPLVLDLLLVGVGGAACLALALGWRTRETGGLLGLVLLVLAAAVWGSESLRARLLPDLLVAGFLLALHLATPPRPFGSWEARTRPDPGGDWRLPPRVWQLVWLALGLLHGLAALGVLPLSLDVLAGLRPSSPMAPPLAPDGLPLELLALLGRGLGLLVLAAALHPPLRRAAWSAILIWQVAWSAAVGWDAVSAGVWLATLLAFDPGWLPPRSRALSAETAGAEAGPEAGPESGVEAGATAAAATCTARLFYDGDCGFCHRSVRFVLAEESPLRPDRLLHFAPLESRAFEALLERHPSLREDLPDSIVLELEDGTLRTRSAAVLEIASRLGGLWRALAVVGSLLPPSVLDRAYDVVARVRKRIFARPKDSCPILPPGLRQRFDP